MQGDENRTITGPIVLTITIFILGLSLGAFTTSQYVKARGIVYLEKGNQIRRHRAILEGEAGNPWQYRPLAPYLIEPVIRLAGDLEIPYHVAISFIFFRVIQDASIFVIAFAYYKHLGLSAPHALIGMILLAWGMSYSHYDSDLQFSTFFDVTFYLLAGLCILLERYIWLVPITILAALNRETSGFIPFMYLFSSIFMKKEAWSKTMPVFGAILLAYVTIYAALRFAYGEQELIIPYDHHPGIELLKFNLFRLVTWEQLFATLSFIPILAMVGYRKWSPHLRVFFWVIVPLWFVVHAFGAVMAEARLFLVPQALIFIPGALFFVQRGRRPVQVRQGRDLS